MIPDANERSEFAEHAIERDEKFSRQTLSGADGGRNTCISP